MTSAKYLGISFVIIAGLFIPARIHAAVVSSSPIVTATSTCSTGLSCGLVGYWTFDGKDTPNGVVRDISGQGNTGTLLNIATSTFYVPGKIGQGFKFDGVNDYVNVGTNNLVGATSFSVSAWMNVGPQDFDGKFITLMDDSGSNFNNNGFFIGIDDRGGGTNATNAILYSFDVSTGNCQGGLINDMFGNTKRWYHVVLTYNGNNSTEGLYIDGVSQATTGSACTGSGTFVPDTNSDMYIGELIGLGFPFKGTLDDVRIYNRALSATEVKQLYNLGAEGHLSVAPPVTATSSCSTGLSCGLVGYWTFDGKDMLNGKALDKSGGSNTGTFSGIATSTFYVPGKMGQAFNFDGVNDYVKVSAAPATSFPLTEAAWVKLGSATTPDNTGQVIVSQIQLSSLAAFYFDYYRQDSFGGTAIRIYAQDSTAANTRAGYKNLTLDTKWHHIVAIWNSASSQTLYIDGIAQTLTGTITAGSGTPTPTGMDTTFVGQTLYNTSSTFGPLNGIIDDVRIYNRALSATEVKQLYNLGNESHQAVSPQVTATSTCSTGLSCGLVGYWTFDGKDTPWTSASAGTTLDKSGSGGTGTLTGMSQVATPGFGKYGQALNFRGGVGEYVNVADANRYSFGNGTTDTPFSLSAWIYYDTGASGSYSNWPIITKWTDIGNAEWSFYTSFADLVGGQSGNGLTLQINKSGGTTDRLIVEGRTPVPNKKWSHVVTTYDGSSTSAGMKVYLNGVQDTTDLFTAGTYTAMSNLAAHVDIGGLISANSSFDAFAKGKIDDVRIYNRALSATEIRQLYNGGR